MTRLKPFTVASATLAVLVSVSLVLAQQSNDDPQAGLSDETGAAAKSEDSPPGTSQDPTEDAADQDPTQDAADTADTAPPSAPEDAAAPADSAQETDTTDADTTDQARDARQQQRDQQQADQQQQRDQQQDDQQSDERGQDDRQADQRDQQELGFAVETNDENQLAVQSIEDGSIAAGIGLQEGDVIVSADGREFNDNREFRRFLGDRRGNRIPIVVLRDGQRQTLYWQAQRAERPLFGRYEEDLRTYREDDRAQQRQYGAIGITLRGERDIVITGVHRGSPAENAGLKPGARILSVDDQQHSDATQIAQAIHRPAGENVRLTVEHQGQRDTFDIQLDQWNEAFAGEAVRMDRQQTMMAERSMSQEQRVMRPSFDDRRGSSAGLSQEVEQLRAKVQQLEDQLQQLRAEMRSNRGGEMQDRDIENPHDVRPENLPPERPSRTQGFSQPEEPATP